LCLSAKIAAVLVPSAVPVLVVIVEIAHREIEAHVHHGEIVHREIVHRETEVHVHHVHRGIAHREIVRREIEVHVHHGEIVHRGIVHRETEVHVHHVWSDRRSRDPKIGLLKIQQQRRQRQHHRHRRQALLRASRGDTSHVTGTITL
jgi:hypothetical protein